jgi:hypothetical protein
MRELLIDIMNIEKQLAPGDRRSSDGSPMPRGEYRSWRSRTHASLVFKRVEYGDLKAWILQRRRELDAANVSVKDPNSPRDVLLAVRALLRDLLDQDVDHQDLGHVYNVVEQHLQHVL